MPSSSLTSILASSSQVGAAELLVLDGADVRHLLDHEQSLRAVRRAFEQHRTRAGRVFPLVRETIDGGAVFGIKAGDIADDGVLGMKAAGYWPANTARSKEGHQATVLLLDPTTGRAIGLFDGNHVTTMRTGAAGAIGIELLGRPDSTRLCVFGTGVQARIQLEFALKIQPSIREVAYVTMARERDELFEQRFAPYCRIRNASDADAAVSEADIVITATPSRAPLFSVAAVQPGTHINAVGADTRGKRELPPGLLERSRLVVDDAIQSRQVGESQWAPQCVMTEIGELLPKPSSFERRPSDITVFDMTGLALQDLVVAKLLLDKARVQGRGRLLPWPW